MSIHKSLVPKSRLRRHRSVLSRTERILKLEEEERWTAEADSVFALPKVRVARLKKSHAKKAVVKAEAAEGAEGAAAGGAAPAAAAAAAAPGAKGTAGAKAAAGGKEARPAKEAKGGGKK